MFIVRRLHLWADEQHRAVLGAGEEGQVVDAESVRLSWFQTNVPDYAVELAAVAICVDAKATFEDYKKKKVVGVESSGGRSNSLRSELFSVSCEHPLPNVALSVLKEGHGRVRGH